MKLQIYTDDGYQHVHDDTVLDDLSMTDLVEILHEKKILSTQDVNKLLPSNFEVVE